VKDRKPQAKKRLAQARPISARPAGRGKKGAGPVPGDYEERLRFETLLTDLSARFINLPAEQVDDAIVDAQRRICECTGLDVVVLWQWEVDAPGLFTLTHSYRRIEGPPLTRQLQAAEAFPWGLREVQAGRSYLFASLDDVPEGAERDRDSCAILAS
jgi:formate hydrogenlyase transcriptional activator